MKNFWIRMRPAILILSAWAILQPFSCKKPGEAPKPDPIAETIKLPKAADTLEVGRSITLVASITPATTNPAAKYRWNTDNSDIVSLKVNEDFSATITAQSEGVATIGIFSTRGDLMASCKIRVEPKPYQDDGILKVLAIGNSFSEDALEQWLYGLATAAGHKIVIGNLMIGGASLALHAENVANNARAYSYRKIGLDGSRSVAENTSIAAALAEEDWDYISYQQVSQNSGQYNTFTTPLPALHTYVKARARNPMVKYVLHQTWAYAQNSTHAGFANYNNNQQTMYEAIVTTYNKAKDLIGADMIVPAGTAIQNGRASLLGDNFNRDGYHLDLNIGRYTASCAWFEKLFGQSVVGNSFKPSSLGTLETDIAQHAAHFAVLQPDQVNPMADYQQTAASYLSKPAYINFGSNSGVPTSWNSLGGYMAGSTIPILKDEEGNNTRASLKVTIRFNGRNPDGPTSTTTNLNLPAAVSSDSYFGNVKKDWGGFVIPESAFKLEGLEAGKEYDLCFFAGRMNVSDNRETKFTVKGSNEAVVYLNASNNSTQTACTARIKADSEGTITVSMTAGENNNNEYGFFYINAMRISPAD